MFCIVFIVFRFIGLVLLVSFTGSLIHFVQEINETSQTQRRKRKYELPQPTTNKRSPVFYINEGVETEKAHTPAQVLITSRITA